MEYDTVIPLRRVIGGKNYAQVPHEEEEESSAPPVATTSVESMPISPPFLEPPKTHAGSGDASTLLSIGAFSIGLMVANDILLGIVTYLPWAWAVLVFCLWLLVREWYEWLYARWLRLTEHEREQRAASRGLIFAGIDFFHKVCAVGGAHTHTSYHDASQVLLATVFYLLLAMLRNVVDLTSETWPVQLFVAAYFVVLVAANLQLWFH